MTNASCEPAIASESSTVEYIPCACCGGSESRVIYKKKSARGEAFSIVRCSACGLVYVNPRKSAEAIASIYRGSDYFQRPQSKGTGYADYTADRELHVRFFRHQLEALESHAPKGKILDIGCAFGFLLDEAQKRGWTGKGVELSDFASEYAREQLGLDVFTGMLKEAALAPEEFNAVVMDDVIEHATDPLAEFEEIRRILKPGGALILHTPNVASRWHFFMRRYWVHLKPEEHLYYFSPKTITILLEKAGFTVHYARSCKKVTNTAYILGVLKKYSPALGSLLQSLIRLAPGLAEKPFWFPGGGMEILATKS